MEYSILDRTLELKAALKPVVSLLYPVHEPHLLLPTLLRTCSSPVGKGRRLSCVDVKLVAHDFVFVLEEASLGRPRGALAVSIINAAVAGAHEQIRLRKPAHWTAEMRAIDGEDLKGGSRHMANPAGGLVCGSVPGMAVWILISGEARFANRELVH